MKAVIVDDELSAQRRLARLLGKQRWTGDFPQALSNTRSQSLSLGMRDR